MHVTNDLTPYAQTRDRAVVDALPEGVAGVATGTPYAVPPGTVRNGSGRALQGVHAVQQGVA